MGWTGRQSCETHQRCLSTEENWSFPAGLYLCKTFCHFIYFFEGSPLSRRFTLKDKLFDNMEGIGLDS